MIHPVILALVSPRFRSLAIELDAAPVECRQEILDQFVAKQPDAAEIQAALDSANPDILCPLLANHQLN